MKIKMLVCGFGFNCTILTNHKQGHITTLFKNMQGQIDDVRIYNGVYPERSRRALTSLQVKTLYNEGFVYRVGPSTGAP